MNIIIMKQKFDELTGFQWNAVNTNYVEVYENLETKYNYVYKTATCGLAKATGLSSGMKAVDIGCGTGISTEVLLTMVGETGQVIGLDISRAMLDKAKEKFEKFTNVLFFQKDAYCVEELIKELHLKGRVDRVYSNFTYYYLSNRRHILHQQVYRLLASSGQWSFNRTSYLARTELGGQAYNLFDSIFMEALDGILRERGYSQGIGSRIGPQLPAISDEVKSLRSAGFRIVRVEPFELPLVPSQAYRFTIDGFYRFGSRPSFSSTLCGMDLVERVQILEETIDIVQKRIDACGERPTIFNFISIK